MLSVYFLRNLCFLNRYDSFLNWMGIHDILKLNRLIWFFFSVWFFRLFFFAGFLCFLSLSVFLLTRSSVWTISIFDSIIYTKWFIIMLLFWFFFHWNSLIHDNVIFNLFFVIMLYLKFMNFTIYSYIRTYIIYTHMEFFIKVVRRYLNK